jgi:hypothetical protein
MTLIMHPAAKQDLLELTKFFFGIDPALGNRFDARVDHYLRLIRQSPVLFHEGKFGIRRVNLAPTFQAYFIAYFCRNDTTVVLAIGHAKRRPYYFRDRIDEARKMF